MSDKISSAVSYSWNAAFAWLVGIFSWLGAITPDWWTVIICFLGTIFTGWMNWHWKKKTFERGEADQ
ncbi:phage holin family protein [Vibrio salinus]|uniref:phage holin family protein n=1 Tax=Vibrio salinus TaxID=2899784 RepID=UPI001E6034B2|nr:phage holin family protein [Vibrio salinus]MCE0495760.1 phage holin family protein [Vibrio salinus]